MSLGIAVEVPFAGESRPPAEDREGDDLATTQGGIRTGSALFGLMNLAEIVNHDVKCSEEGVHLEHKESVPFPLGSVSKPTLVHGHLPLKSSTYNSHQAFKAAYQSAPSLAKELRAFAADTETRDAFKPEHLCGEIDHLIAGLKSNLNRVKYSVDYTRIDDLRNNLDLVGNYDANIYQSYDQFARQLDTLATQLQDPSSFDVEERRRYAQHVIEDFETDLNSAVAGVRKTKDSIVHGI
jgi:hypothetical protein